MSQRSAITKWRAAYRAFLEDRIASSLNHLKTVNRIAAELDDALAGNSREDLTTDGNDLQIYEEDWVDLRGLVVVDKSELEQEIERLRRQRQLCGSS